MATAPRPMPESRADKAARLEAQQTVLSFKAGDRTYRLAPFNLPITEKLTVQAQLHDLGLTWEEVLRPLLRGRISSASMAVVVWVARRVSGEPTLTWLEHAEEWDDQDLGTVVQLEVLTPDDGDDPEV